MPEVMAGPMVESMIRAIMPVKMAAVIVIVKIKTRPSTEIVESIVIPGVRCIPIVIITRFIGIVPAGIPVGIIPRRNVTARQQKT
jgi:hypothetical protein